MLNLTIEDAPTDIVDAGFDVASPLGELLEEDDRSPSPLLITSPDIQIVEAARPKADDKVVALHEDAVAPSPSFA